jgi:hypothetical protein
MESEPIVDYSTQKVDKTANGNEPSPHYHSLPVVYI